MGSDAKHGPKAETSTDNEWGYTLVELPWLPQSFFLDPPVRWDYLSPLMREWAWQGDAPNTRMRELLALLRASRLRNWSHPTREPVCILDDLAVPAGGSRSPRRRQARMSAGGAYAASMPYGRRVVVATLHAARGLDVLASHETDQLMRRARELKVPWPDIADVLRCSRQAAQQRLRSRRAPAFNQSTWEGSTFLARFGELITLLRDLHLDQVQSMTSGPNIVDMTRTPLTDRDRRRIQMADDLLEVQLYWAELPENHRDVLAALCGAQTLRSMIARVVEQLVYEARERRATWDDVGQALGHSAQAVHQKYADRLSEASHLRAIEDGLNYDLRQAGLEAMRMLRARDTSLEDHTTAELFFTFGDSAAHGLESW